MKKLTILVFSGLLFSCCPEKNNPKPETPQIHKIEKADSNRFKPFSEVKEGIVPEDDFELIGDCCEGEFGAV